MIRLCKSDCCVSRETKTKIVSVKAIETELFLKFKQEGAAKVEQTLLLK